MRARLLCLALFLVTCCLMVAGCCKDCPPPNTGNAGSGGGAPIGQPASLTGKKCVSNTCPGATGDPCTVYGACIAQGADRFCSIVVAQGNECRTGEATPCTPLAGGAGVYVCNPNTCKWDTNACKPCGGTTQQCCLGALRCTATTDTCEGDPAFPSTGVCKKRI